MDISKEELWRMSQYNPPCLVYQYKCDLCPFFKKPDRCLLNTNYNDLEEEYKL